MIAAGSLVSVRHLRNSEAERQALAENARLLHRLLDEADIPFISADSHIVSAFIGDDQACKQVSRLLFERHGMYVQPINAPSVPVGQEILRIAPSAVHTRSDVEDFAEALRDVWKELGIPSVSDRRLALQS